MPHYKYEKHPVNLNDHLDRLTNNKKINIIYQTMSSETRDFPGLPPFPKDVPTAPLLCLSLQKLIVSDNSEIKRLIEACEDLGFFYLDLQNCGPASGILDDVDKLFAISKEFYTLSLEEKKKYNFSAQNSYFGYKSQGAVVVDKNGARDRNESYNVGNHAVDMKYSVDLSFRFPRLTC